MYQRQYIDGVYHVWADKPADLRELPMPTKNQERFNRSLTMHGDDPDWFGVPGGADAVYQAVENGWPDGRDKAYKSLGRLSLPAISSTRRKRRYSSAGGVMVDPHRINSGRMDFWEDYPRGGRMTAGGDTHITIAVESGGHSGKTADDMFWSGAVAALAAEAMISSGRNVRIIAGQRTTRIDDRNNQLICHYAAKNYGEPLNLDRVISMTALSGVHRTYHFQAICSTDYAVDQNLGTPQSTNAQANKSLPAVPGEQFIQIPAMSNVYEAQRKLDEIASMFQPAKAA